MVFGYLVGRAFRLLASNKQVPWKEIVPSLYNCESSGLKHK